MLNMALMFVKNATLHKIALNITRAKTHWHEK